jgi:hypothetical protein
MNKILFALLGVLPVSAFATEPTTLQCKAQYEVRTPQGALQWKDVATVSSEIRYGGAIVRGVLPSGESFLAELNLLIDDHHDHEYNTEFYMHVKKDERTTWSSGMAPRRGEAVLSVASTGLTRDGDTIQAVQVRCELR